MTVVLVECFMMQSMYSYWRDTLTAVWCGLLLLLVWVARNLWRLLMQFFLYLTSCSCCRTNSFTALTAQLSIVNCFIYLHIMQDCARLTSRVLLKLFTVLFLYMINIFSSVTRKYDFTSVTSLSVRVNVYCSVCFVVKQHFPKCGNLVEIDTCHHGALGKERVVNPT